MRGRSDRCRRVVAGRTMAAPTVAVAINVSFVIVVLMSISVSPLGRWGRVGCGSALGQQ
jgi:hypothetical protein